MADASMFGYVITAIVSAVFIVGIVVDGFKPIITTFSKFLDAYMEHRLKLYIAKSTYKADRERETLRLAQVQFTPEERRLLAQTQEMLQERARK